MTDITSQKNSAEVLIARLGGCGAVADMLNLTYMAVYQWIRRGDKIPQKYWKPLKRAAADRGIELTFEDFMGEGAV